MTTLPKLDSDAIRNEASYIGARMREPSTYTGLAVLLGLAGLHLTPDVGKALVELLMAAGALIGVVLPETGSKQ